MAKIPNRDTIKAELMIHKYAYKESENLTRLGEMVQRARRGLISYEKRTPAELRNFCSQRRINVPQKGASKRDLIAVLWNADDNPFFAKLFDLPPELRLRIYEILFHDICISHFCTNIVCSHPLPKAMYAQPLITRASRALRQEALPAFYDTVYAHIKAQGPPLDDYSVLAEAPDVVISRLRRIRLEARLVWPDPVSLACEWGIRLSSGKKVKVRCMHARQLIGEGLRLPKLIDARIRQILSVMEARGGATISLCRADMRALSRVIADVRYSMR